MASCLGSDLLEEGRCYRQQRAGHLGSDKQRSRVHRERCGRSRQASPQPIPQAGSAESALSEAPETNVDGTDISWKEKLLGILKSMAPDSFERLSQRILRESGFTKVEVQGRSGDGGIDGAGVLRMNLVSFHVLFQYKRWKDTFSASVIRNFRGAMIGQADKGLIITTGRFTSDAQREAVRDGAPAIDLVDGETFCDLLKGLRLGVEVRSVEVVEIHPDQLKGI